MFDGSSEQFHQFIVSSSTTSLPFPLHVTPSFDPYAPPLHHHNPPPPPPPPSKTAESDNPWSNDELLSLFKLRSSMEIWFPDFTWEHVSRKLGEIGFKRSAEQCKEKFEEESRNFIYIMDTFPIFSPPSTRVIPKTLMPRELTGETVGEVKK